MVLSNEKIIQNCSKHGDYEAKVLKLPSGNEIKTNCEICINEEREIEQKKSYEENLSNALRRCKIPKRFFNSTFENFSADTPDKVNALSVCFEYANEFDSNFQKGNNLIFSGNVGTGKTHLATAIAKYIMHNNSVIYISTMDFICEVRSTWKKDAEFSETEVKNKFKKANLLIIDEIGVQFGTEAEIIQLFDILDYRYREVLPTILITNLNLEGIKKVLGERVFDRLKDSSKLIIFNWESQRGKNI